MLRRFVVKNYKGFKDELVFDLSNTHDYKFNQEFVIDGICNKSLIYGKNGSGKSNLGRAIMDITHHLTSNPIQLDISPYQNLENKNNIISFSYDFVFDNDTVQYSYERSKRNDLVKETLLINEKEVLSFDIKKKSISNNLESAAKIDFSQYNFGESLVYYVYTRGGYDKSDAFFKFVDFVNKMLFFRSLRANEFEGNGRITTFADILLRHGEKAVKGLERFLKENGINYNLIIMQDINTGLNDIFVVFDNKSVLLRNIWSTGTSALVLFYCWFIDFNSVSFLYLDEFDAFYHYELSENILKLVNENENIQSVVTTHNTSLMNNKMTRPDCCFIIDANKTIKSLADCTQREIREAHNLENLYKNGAFCE